MILKAGNYTFNETIDLWEGDNYPIDFSVTFQGEVDGETVSETLDFTYIGSLVEITGDNALVYGMGDDYTFQTVYEDGVWIDPAPNNTWRNVSIAKDTKVDYNFADWFITNTNYYEVNPPIILKAGTYRFNNNILLPDFTNATAEDGLVYRATDIPCYVDIDGEHEEYVGIVLIQLDYETDNFLMGYWCDKSSPLYSVWVYNKIDGWASTQSPFDENIELAKTHTITEDTEVDDTFGTWYKANTNYNEVNPTETPIATITYNGETIAQLNAGETATLSCEGKKMASDVTVKVNSILQGATAYTVSSVDELPINAVDGSMAIVESDSMMGLWRLQNFYDYENVGVGFYGTFYLDFYLPLITKGEGGYGYIYDSIVVEDRGDVYISYCFEGEQVMDGAYDGGGVAEYMTIYITKEPTDTNAINFLNTYADKIGSGHTLYTRENGEWVYKCEVV